MPGFIEETEEGAGASFLRHDGTDVDSALGSSA
jgi:hypothetical protein